MSETKQPVWEFVCNLGDVNVADYGGFLVYRDTTGAYPPEAELYEANDDETGGMRYRVVLDPPRFKTFRPPHVDAGVFGDPKQRGISWSWYREWFAQPDKLKSAAESAGMSAFSLLRALASKDPATRGRAYQTVIGCWGPGEFDSYPLKLTEVEAQERYRNIQRYGHTG